MKQHDCILITADHRRAIQSANEQPQHVNTQYLALKLQWEDWSSKLYIYIFSFKLCGRSSTCFVQLSGSFEEAWQRGLQHHDKIFQLFCYADQHVLIHQVVLCLLQSPLTAHVPTHKKKEKKKSCFSFRCGYFLFILRESLLCWMGKKIPHSLEKLSRNGGEEWCKAWHGGRGGDGEKSSREELKDRQDERLGEQWVRRGLRQQESGAKGKKKKKAW